MVVVLFVYIGCGNGVEGNNGVGNEGEKLGVGGERGM